MLFLHRAKRTERPRAPRCESDRRRPTGGPLRGVFLIAFAAFIAQASGFPSAAAGSENAGGRDRMFVEIASRTVVIHCGSVEVALDSERGFSVSAKDAEGGRGKRFLSSTRVRFRLDGREQNVSFRARASAVALIEEGPQRIVLRAPFTLWARAGEPLANGQYEIACYPEGEIFATLRLLVIGDRKAEAAVELSFATGGECRFRRAYDLPLVFAASDSRAFGLYWHSGDEPKIGALGGEMRCVLALAPEEESGGRVLSRSFVISSAPSAGALRRRCLDHIQPLQPRDLDSCRPLVEETPENLGIAASVPGWCYNFRDGTYNLLVEGPRAVAEFVNRSDEKRHIRVRFVNGAGGTYEIAAGRMSRPLDSQIVSLNPGGVPTRKDSASAALAAFDLPPHECLAVEAVRSNDIQLEWAGARVVGGGITRLFRIVCGPDGRRLAEIRTTDGGPFGGVEIRSLRPVEPLGAPPAVASLAVVPAGGTSLGRFSHIEDLAILRNRPGRIALKFAATNESKSVACLSDIVFRREGKALAVFGYQSLEVRRASRSLRPTFLDMPSFALESGKGRAERAPQMFFAADRKKKIRKYRLVGGKGVGQSAKDIERLAMGDALFCGFSGPATGQVGFLARPLDGGAFLAGEKSSPPRVSVRMELPPAISQGRVFRLFWKMEIVGAASADLAATEKSLALLKGRPVDLRWVQNRFVLDDARIAHRIYELSPSGNPISEDGRCYLVDGGGSLAVVGAGADSLRGPWFFRIRALGLNPKKIGAILLTDASADCAGGAKALKALTGAPVFAHQSAVEALSVAGPEQDQRTIGFSGEPGAPFESVAVDHPLGDKETIRVGDLDVRFLHLPGSCGESGAYFVQAAGVSAAFVGDLLSCAETKVGGGRGDAHRHGNLNLWIDSLDRLRAEHVDLALPGGHGTPLSGIQAITNACNLGVERCETLLRMKKTDYLLPRPFVAKPKPENRGPKGDDLRGVKELPRPALRRVRPIEIAPGLWRVGGGFVGEYEDANVYLVDGGDGQMALIGAGSGLHTGAIIDRILSLGKNPLDIKYILLPSSHWYEARGAESLRAATGAKICAHRYEIAPIARGDVLRTGLLVGDFFYGVFPPCRVDRELEWGETLEVGRREILVLDAPGFHAGSTAFLMTIGGRRCLAVGEAALGDLPTPDGDMITGATGWLDPHWGGCISVWRRTLERFVALRPDVLLPGQGPVEKDEVVTQLRDCLERLEKLEGESGARWILPAAAFDVGIKPRRPDISRLTSNR